MRELLQKRYQQSFHSSLVQGADFVGKYDFPMLKPTTYAPTKAIPFDKMKSVSDKNQWVHFYIDDYRFECLWNQPNRYIPMLKAFDGVIGTDFSVYTDMPLAMQIWNTYRNRAMCHFLAQNGIVVIPNVVWGLENTYEFCFNGISVGSTVAVSTNGCIRDKLDRYHFKKGLYKMVQIIEPKAIVVYSQMPDDIFGEYIKDGVNIVNIPNYNDTIRNRGVV